MLRIPVYFFLTASRLKYFRLRRARGVRFADPQRGTLHVFFSSLAMSFGAGRFVICDTLNGWNEHDENLT